MFHPTYIGNGVLDRLSCGQKSYILSVLANTHPFCVAQPTKDPLSAQFSKHCTVSFWTISRIMRPFAWAAKECRHGSFPRARYIYLYFIQTIISHLKLYFCFNSRYKKVYNSLRQICALMRLDMRWTSYQLFQLDLFETVLSLC